MNPPDWQAYQAQRGAAPQQPAPPGPPSYGPGDQGRPKKQRHGLGWPMAMLLLGLAVIGGCCYSFGRLTDSIKLPLDSGRASGPAVGVLVMEDEIYGSIWATDVINKFKEDDKIKAVVIRINSPGGAVAPCQEIYQAVKSLNKPVVVSMGSVAASGGLYVAAAGDLIMANPGTITGSIGVIMQSIEVSGTMEKVGLRSLTIKSGQFKDIGSPFREMRADERALLEAMVQDVYEQFLADLTAGRNKVNPDELRRLADGRIYSGAEAQKLGLVDELGGFEEAVMRAAKMGGLPAGKRPDLVVEDGRKPWWEVVMYSLYEGGQASLKLPPAFQPGFTLKYMYQPDLGQELF
ncbi:MAG: signal peptide peptidase SppA [Candidatus Adiutrix sp.]|jgi:protease-4|nr:signal peptide peptidase SppA [Candidatus Adiutrix sp.]